MNQINELSQAGFGRPANKGVGSKGADTFVCDKMYECETSFFGWRESHLLNNDDVLQKIFQWLPYKLKSQFVSMVDKGLGTFTQRRELVKNAALKANTACGQLLS